MSNIARIAGKRWLRYMPLISLAVCYLLFNFVYGLYPQDINKVRLPLAAWVIAGATALWPLLTPGAISSGGLFVISVATVGAALYLVPVWTGHGCWSPDLMSLAGMVLIGVLGAAFATRWLRAAVADLDSRRAGRTALVLTIALAVTVCWAWPPGVFGSRVMPAAGHRPGEKAPAVLWRTTTWSDVLSKLLPMIGRPGPVTPRLAVTAGGRLLVLASVQEALLRDAGTGKAFSALKLVSAPGGAGRSPDYVYQEIQTSGSLLALAGPGWMDLYDLATSSFLCRIADVWQGQALLTEDGLVAVHGYDQGKLRGYDPQGSVRWETDLVPRSAAPADQPIEVHGPDPHGTRVQVVGTGTGFIAAGGGGLVAAGADGARLWELPLNLRLPSLLRSPEGNVVYVAGIGQTADHGGVAPVVVAVSAARGTELWRETLPESTVTYHWAALHGGLVLSHETVERAPGADPYTVPLQRRGSTRLLDAGTGNEVWAIPEKGSLLSGFYVVGGDVLVLAEQTVRRYRGETGELEWVTDLDTLVGYHVRPLNVGTAVVVETRGYEALDAATGERLWRYWPSGSGWSAATDGERLFVGSSRGLYCVSPGGPR